MSSGPPAAPGPTKALGGRALLFVGLVLAAAIVGAYLLFHRTRSAPSPATSSSEQPEAPAPPRTSIALFALRPKAGSEAVSWLGDSVPVFGTLSLENEPTLRVLTPERIQDLMRQMPASEAADELAVARKGGVDFLLKGEVAGKPGAVAFNVTWLECASGREREHWAIDGIGEANLGMKLDGLVAKIREALRLGPPDPDNPLLAGLVPIKEAPTRSFVEAAMLLAKGQPGGCTSRLADALALTDFPLAQFLQALSAAYQGNRTSTMEGVRSLQKVHVRLPIRVTLLTPFLLAMYGTEDPRGAVAPLESFLARFPEEKRPLAWLGALDLQYLNDPARARDTLRKALALDPADSDTQMLLSQAALRSDHADEAVPLLEGFLKSHPDNDEVRLELAGALRQAGRAAESGQEVQKILSRQPEKSEALQLQAALYLDEKRPDDARAAYEKIGRSSAPQDQLNHEVLLVRVDLLQGRFNEATRRLRAFADRARKAGSAEQQARSLLMLGEIQASLGRYQEATATLSEIHGIESTVQPDLPMISVMIYQKRFDDARKMLETQIQRWSKASPAFLAKLRDALEGSIALEEGRFSDAVSRMKSSLPEEGEPPTSELLGRACLGAGDYPQAEAIFTRIVKNPDRYSDPVGYILGLIRLGTAQEKQGHNEEALKSYRTALGWWDRPDYTVPEVTAARDAVTRLSR